MYNYKFVKIELKKGLVQNKPEEDYQQIIQEHAQDGWRFVQLFAPSTFGYGSATYFELIFEKQA